LINLLAWFIKTFISCFSFSILKIKILKTKKYLKTL
jgi:hypothetical protein